MDLIGFIIAGQRVHHQVDAEAVGHFALAWAAFRYRTIGLPASSVAQADAQSLLPTMIDETASFWSLVRFFHPHRAIGVAAGKTVQQVKTICAAYGRSGRFLQRRNN